MGCGARKKTPSNLNCATLQVPAAPTSPSPTNLELLWSCRLLFLPPLLKFFISYSYVQCPHLTCYMAAAWWHGPAPPPPLALPLPHPCCLPLQLVESRFMQQAAVWQNATRAFRASFCFAKTASRCSFDVSSASCNCGNCQLQLRFA